MSTLKTTNLQHPSASTANITLGSTGSVAVNGSMTGAGMDLISSQAVSSVTSVIFNNVFTSAYQNYLVNISLTDPASSQTMTMRMRASGTDSSASSYHTMTIGANAISQAQYIAGNAITNWVLGYNGNTSNFFSTLTVFRPQEAVRTAISGTSVSNNSSYNAIIGWATNGWLDSTAQFDGFSILCAASFSGNIRVYGYRNS